MSNPGCIRKIPINPLPFCQRVKDGDQLDIEKMLFITARVAICLSIFREEKAGNYLLVQ